jgi:hypothetical protein
MPINIYITRREEDQPWTGKIVNVRIENCSFETVFPRKIQVRRLADYTSKDDLSVTFHRLTIEGKQINSLDPAHFDLARCNGLIHFE